MKSFDCPLCRKDSLIQEENIRLVTELEHNQQRAKYVYFHQYVCPSCGYIALTKPPEEGDEPEAIIN